MSEQPENTADRARIDVPVKQAGQPMPRRPKTRTPRQRVPAWYLWYFALAAFTILTLSASLALNYSQSRSFQTAVDAHAVSAKLLARIGEVRTLAIAVNAPGNDVFSSHDYVRESQRLDVAAARFRDGYASLLALAQAELTAAQYDDLEQQIPHIEVSMARMLNEARQIMSFLARGDSDAAGQRMAAMDREYGTMTERISSMERVIQERQRAALAEQRMLGQVVQQRGVWLAAAALLMIAAAGLYGHRVVVAMRREALQRKRYTRKLARARDQAEHAAKIKSQFLANMSHEIRTPMNGVLGMLDALSGTDMSAHQAHMLRTANASADLLLSIIDDILDFSKIEAGMLVIEEVPLDLQEIVQRVVSLYNIRAYEKNIALRYDLPANLPIQLLGDATRITQLLSNFVSNAIKFTATGEVAIRAEIIEDCADYAYVRCSVQDNGIGIPDEVQRRLFTPFTQADGSTSRRFGGTGLGLAICKQLIGMLDSERGAIGVQSMLGEGATFFFALRLRKPTASAEPMSASNSMTAPLRFRGRVLVAEDNETNQQVAITLLRALGLDPVLAKNGREAVDKLANEHFALVLMDYHMPELDGCGATLAIRRLECERGLPRTPIVAVTASVLKEDKARCEAAGMDDFLSKPIRQRTLAAVLSKWLPASPAEETVTGVKSDADVGAAFDPDIDIEQFDEMRAISGDDFDGLLNQFHISVRDSIDALHAAVAAHDASALKRTAHKLKGTASALGARQLAALCLELEKMGHEGRIEGAQKKIVALTESYLKVRVQFEQRVVEGIAATQRSASASR
jgi:signal transduction histidine kinase/HPt (histidine-containing phosphotransfer) domain-containing protein